MRGTSTWMTVPSSGRFEVHDPAYRRGALAHRREAEPAGPVDATTRLPAVDREPVPVVPDVERYGVLDVGDGHRAVVAPACRPTLVSASCATR